MTASPAFPVTTGWIESSAAGSGPVVGVKTTRIYCRPICRPGRMPRPENCIPFVNVAAARVAGYRACKLCVPDDPVPPERLRRATTIETVLYGSGPTPLGTAFAATTGRGLCALFFLSRAEANGTALDRLSGMFPSGQLVEDADAVVSCMTSLADWLDGGPAPTPPALDLRGTAFQLAVWEALRLIPSGSTCTYGALARRIGRASASRAVGAACGANPVAVFVPCHRVVGSDGRLVNYRWGLERKRALLDREAGRPLPHLSR